MNYKQGLKIVIAKSKEDFDHGRELFEEYYNAINFNAGFKNFQAELTSLELHYAAPDGCLLLAYIGDHTVGCIAVLKAQDKVAELKRFYVRPAFRKFKIGAKLLESAVSNAKLLHFSHLRLEVIPSLTKAKELYNSFGFVEIEPFRNIVLKGTVYMEKDLE